MSFSWQERDGNFSLIVEGEPFLEAFVGPEGRARGGWLGIISSLKGTSLFHWNRSHTIDEAKREVENTLRDMGYKLELQERNG